MSQLFSFKILKNSKKNKLEEAIRKLDNEQIKFNDDKSKFLEILRQAKTFISKGAKLILSTYHGKDFDEEISLITELSTKELEDNDNIEENALIIQKILGFFFRAVEKFENSILEQKKEKITVFEKKKNQDSQVDEDVVLTIIANLLKNHSDIFMMFIKACEYCSKDISISMKIYQFNEIINMEVNENSILNSFQSTFTENEENSENYLEDAFNFCAEFPEHFENFKINIKFFIVICAVYLHENINQDLKVSIIENLEDNFENIKKEGELNMAKTDLILEFFHVLQEFQQEKQKTSEIKFEKLNNDESLIINSLMSPKKKKKKTQKK